MNSADVIVIGAGAAGMFCAGVLGQRGKRVLLLDHAKTLGEKIRISGGGRCNFTNRDSSPSHFLSLNPDFARSALARYSPADFVTLVNRYRIQFHEKHRGQLFCDESSHLIIQMLREECLLGGVEILHPVEVRAVIREGHQWRVKTDAGSYQASSIVMATGGLPVPAIGASAFALDFAKTLDIPIAPVRPGLVPLAFTSDAFRGLESLAGLSLPVCISAGRKGVRYGASTFDEDLLMTHKGLSGPAVLQASNYWEEGEDIVLDWSAGLDLEAVLNEKLVGAKTTEGALATFLPERLAQAFSAKIQLQGKKWAEISRVDRQSMIRQIQHWQVKPAGTLGWKKAEVMLGGIDTDALDSKTMMTKNFPGLYFIGECVDVTGHLGGHNFQWAWASGYACALAISA
ncbi:MAG: aminoacetone oxidase family FAD-binding enzyme [Betaproteobacteria bacterium]|nr:aminoacetone oxidase family FAD-binding enzyme [Betaproteobacteria bacterium]